MSDLRYVGGNYPRPDAADKATGRARYIGDLVRPGMLHGKVKFSEHAHARILNIDTSRAERLPGVRAVVTAANTPELRLGFLRDNFALKGGVVRQFRDEVAAVAAICPEIAAEAVELIRVDYEPVPAVFSVEEALAEGAPLVHATDALGKPRTTNELFFGVRHESGDLAAGERAARFIAEGRFSTQLIQQSCMGTAGCIAELDHAGNLTMWAKTQIPFLAQRDFLRALAALGLRERNARVIVPTLGGAFGTGLDTHTYEYIAILLAHRTGRPVKMLYTREEEFACLSPRQSTESRVVQGCDAEGRLTFRRVEVMQDNGAYTSWGATYPTVMLVPATSLYRVPNVAFDARVVYTNNTYCQAMRGYGGPEVTWGIESTLDELAIQAGIDPLDIRLINCNEPGEVTPMGAKVTTCGLRQCLERSAERLAWREKRAAAGAEAVPDAARRGDAEAGSAAQRAGEPVKRRGLGIASLAHVGGSGRIYRSDGGGVILKLDDYGNVNVSYGGVEMGQGLHSALALTVADALGVRPAQVIINETDTATCLWDVGTHASRGAFIACNAALRAAGRVRRRVFELAVELFPEEIARNVQRHLAASPGAARPSLEALGALTPESFELAEGWVFLKDGPSEGWARVELDRLLRAAHFRGVLGQVVIEEAYYEPPSELPDWKRGLGNMSATYAYGTQAVEVEVDEGTGEVRILEAVSAHDVGKVLNRQTLIGQVVGGFAQGVGYALYEEIKTDRGRVLNPSFTDYKLPTAVELGFPLHCEFVETDDPAGPFGAKGVGEPGLVPTAPAIANAIYDAIGVRIRDLPLTPEKILAAIRAKSELTDAAGVAKGT